MINQFKTALGAALICAASSLPVSATTFYLGGSGGSASSYAFSSDGIDLSVSAGTFSGNRIHDGAQIHQTDDGLGVLSQRRDSGQVDGRGRNDLLLFEFDRDIELEAIAFTFNDRNDDFTFFWDIGSGLRNAGQYDIPGSSWFSIIYAGGGLIGDVFGIGATGNNDNFRVVGIEVSDVSQVPLPATGLLLLGALGAIGARRKLRR